MKHLPLNHSWQVLTPFVYWEYDTCNALDFKKHPTTYLRLFCACGKVKEKKVADFEMTDSQIETYVDSVYN